jgi:hypothetical protein
MRPSVDKLLYKLRGLSNLKNNPDNVEYVIHDLTYQFFMREAARPQHLFRTMIRTEALWRMALNASGVSTQFGPTDIVDRRPAEVSDDTMLANAVEVPELPITPDEVLIPATGGNAEAALGGAVSPPAEPGIDWTSKELKDAVGHAIEMHFPTWSHRGVTCSCHRSYSGRAEWANHARIHVWRVMRDEFPMFGKNAEEAIGHTVKVIDD